MKDRVFFAVVAGWIVGLVAGVVNDIASAVYHLGVNEGQLMLSVATVMGGVILFILRDRPS